MSIVLWLGAGLGLGIALVARGVRPPAPGLTAALHGLERPMAAPSRSWVHRTLDRLVARTAGPASAADLALVGRSTEQHAARTVAAAVVLVAVPVAAALMALAVGLRPPVGAVGLTAVVLGAVGAAAPGIELRGRARELRAVFVHALSSFLDVTAVLLAGGAGTESALHAAAALGDDWPHRRLRAALHRCRLTGQTPWQVLAELGQELEIDELAQLATSLQLAGEQGARVRRTLAARARALRAAQVAAVEARARAVTEQMSVPVALLAVAFMLFVGFPAVWVVLGAL